eukprot:TRINITY_DN11716_c0_g1_i1.p1 TRINITY_DN11716_c0_g1~~TRINITY_DN11716_c0_g1_i1.p1  ORF type:complete len:108 (-),score=17.55 TRINITY_DN11716_c0_g1_i1:460-783(-)
MQVGDDVVIACSFDSIVLTYIGCPFDTFLLFPLLPPQSLMLVQLLSFPSSLPTSPPLLMYRETYCVVDFISASCNALMHCTIGWVPIGKLKLIANNFNMIMGLSRNW